MSNTITIELCAEDRARLDRLTQVLETRAAQVEKSFTANELRMKEAETIEEIQQRLADTLAKASEPVEAPKNAAEEAETSTPTTTPQEEEKPTGEEIAQPEPTKKVSHTDVKNLYIKLAAAGKRESAKAIIMPISATISGIPEDKLNEVYDKLKALEG